MQGPRTRINHLHTVDTQTSPNLPLVEHPARSLFRQTLLFRTLSKHHEPTEDRCCIRWTSCRRGSKYKQSLFHWDQKKLRVIRFVSLELYLDHEVRPEASSSPAKLDDEDDDSRCYPSSCPFLIFARLTRNISKKMKLKGRSRENVIIEYYSSRPEIQRINSLRVAFLPPFIPSSRQLK
jgi:hypothetical protein